MTYPPNSNNPQSPTQEPETVRSGRGNGLLWLRRSLPVTLASLLLVGGTAGAWSGWRWLHEELAPMVEEAIDGIIDREFQMGQLESIVPQLPPGNFRLRFGSSGLPPTQTDASYATTQGVEVLVGLGPRLWERSLGVNLDIKLIKPQVYLQEDENGNWFDLNVAPQAATWLKIATDRVEVEDGKVIVVPFPQASPITLSSINGKVNIFGNNQHLKFDTKGKLASASGEFEAQGEVLLTLEQANIGLRTKALSLAPLSSLIPDELPVTISAGLVDSNISVRYRKHQPSINGTVSFRDIAAIANLAGIVPPESSAKQTAPLYVTGTQGKLRFQEQVISIEEVSTLYAGQIPITAHGKIDISKGGLDVLAQVGPVTVEKVMETVGVKPPVETTGEVKIGVNIKGPFDGPVLQANLGSSKPIRIDKVDFQTISAQAEFINNTLLLDSVTIKPEVGGKITAKGEVKLGEKAGIALDVMLEQLPGDAIASLYGFSPGDITLGEISAEGQIFGPAGDIQVNLSSNIAGGSLSANGRMTDGNLQADIQASEIQLVEIAPQVPPELRSPLNARIELEAPGEKLSLDSLSAVGKAEMGLAGGTVKVDVNLAQKEWQSRFEINQIKLPEVSPQLPSNLQIPFTGTAVLSGNLDSLDMESIEGTGEGRIFIADERVNLAGTLQDGKWLALVEASQVKIDRLASLALEIPPEFQGVSGSTILKLAGDLNSKTVADIQGAGQVWLDRVPVLERGPLTATWEWDGDRVKIAQLSTSGLSINGLISPDWQQPVNSEFVLNVTLTDVNLADLPSAMAENVKLGGKVDFAGAIEGQFFTPKVDGLLWVRGLEVNDFMLDPVMFGPVTAAVGEGVSIDLAGTQDRIALLLKSDYYPESFTVKLDEAIARGRSDGEQLLIDLSNFQLGMLNIQPEYGPGPLSGLLSGNFNVNLKDCISEFSGSTVQGVWSKPLDRSWTVPVVGSPLRLRSGTTQTPLRLTLRDHLKKGGFRKPPLLEGGVWGGSQATTFDYTPVQGNCLAGKVAIASPGVGHLQANKLEAGFRYGRGLGVLESSSLQLGESEYQFTGQFNIPKASGKGKVKIVRGDIQDILETLQWFEFADLARGLGPPTYGSALDLEIYPVGEDRRDLLSQLRRFSEITTLVRFQTQGQESNPIPELSELDGKFSGEVTLATAPATGIAANFEIWGRSWTWGEYQFNPIVLKGSFADNVIYLLPLRIQSQETLLTFNGQVGEAQQLGQLRLENLPVELIERFVPQKLPVDITGKINVTATLGGGTLANPRAIGEMRLVDGTLNETALELAKGSFSLSNGRLLFASQVKAGGSELVEIKGSIPNFLPIGAVSPISPEIKLDVYVEDEGLAVLNILTREQVKWGGGSGFFLAEVRGTFDQPVVNGSSVIENGIFTTEQIGEALTEAKGLVQFDGDRILVERFKGNFSGGQIRVSGVLPILKSLNSSSVDNPLTIDLENLALDFNGLFEGNVDGNIVVSGTALSPEIGGNIRMDKGKVFLSQAAETQATAVANSQEASGELAIVPEFKELQISLGDRVFLRWPGLMNFRATGDLTLNGTLDDLRPRGDIFLPRGQVNLYTTQFRLTQGYNHKAQFKPNQGLEPELDIRLETAVTEVAGARQANVISASEEEIFFRPPEISDRPVLGGLGTQTVEIEARVKGSASGIQTADALTLRSSPRRSSSEIIALLGGGFANTLSGSGGTLALANLAGTALLSNIENAIADGLGLTSLRLFPVLNLNEGQQAGVFPLGLGAEASTKITDSFSASVLKIMTDDRPAQFSLHYRIDERLRLRGATNFSGDDRAQIEYEIQF